MSDEFMRAAGVEAFGAPLRDLTVPMPAPGPDEVVVRVGAAAVNPADLGMVAGRYRWADPVRFPLVPGYDVAGWRVDTGAPVVGFTLHKATQRGGYAQFVALPSALVAPLPASADITAAAALPLAGLTALQSLDALGPGIRTLLINGSARGAVAGFAAQLATARGITVVTDVSDLSVTVDAALDVAGGAAARAAFDRVRDGGRYVTVVPEYWIPGGPFAPSRGIAPHVVSVAFDRPAFLQLVRAFGDGTLRPAVGTCCRCRRPPRPIASRPGPPAPRALPEK
ncbi:alcohol dehydrogenase catalytic domain-containing protein [Dactylosporangium sp. CA-139066]|uniref:alcohol dehydrogenase catalytic domain-containing protein n=1 Tax=Dactylosporangium sp. CA-139066 TaxID=3239930 RepID=UPI003D92D368